jgi:phospholipid transport system substrate-binding protein
MIKTSVLIAVIIVLNLTFNLASASEIYSKEIEDLVKNRFTQIKIMLSELQTSNKSIKRELIDRIFKEIDQSFDFTYISKKCLSRHWKQFSEFEKTDFKRIFAKYIKYYYILKIFSETEGKKIEHYSLKVTKPRKEGMDKISIQTSTLYNNSEVNQIVYYLKRDTEIKAWLIYNVKVEKISFIENWRKSFYEFLRNKKPLQLIARLKDKVYKQNKRLFNY